MGTARSSNTFRRSCRNGLSATKAGDASRYMWRTARFEILRLAAHEGELTVASLLPHLGRSKPTLRSRIGYLERLGLLRPEERFNRGGGDGGSNPNHWRSTPEGHALLHHLMSGAREAPH